MAAWKGAIEIKVNGVPFPANVLFNARKKSTRGPGFKMVGPDGLPPVGRKYEATSGNEITSDDIRKAVSVGRGKQAVLHPLSSEAVETITDQGKTVMMEADYLAPVASLPVEDALMSYDVTPDLEVAGAERSVNVLWNGLRATGLAYVSHATIGTRDSIVAIWAGDIDEGLKAVSLPFVAEMYPPTGYDAWQVDQEQGNVMAQSFEQEYEIKTAFDHKAFASDYEARRNAVIDKVLAGQDVPAPEAPKPTEAAPDLMAMLTKSVKTKAKAKAAGQKARVTV